MCGIVGYIGTQPAIARLLHGLRELDYRGYDSAGVAVLSSEGLRCFKAGMLPSALRDWPIDPTRAYLIGDKASDLEAAERTGVQGIRYDGTTSSKVLLEDRVNV